MWSNVMKAVDDGRKERLAALRANFEKTYEQPDVYDIAEAVFGGIDSPCGTWGTDDDIIRAMQENGGVSCLEGAENADDFGAERDKWALIEVDEDSYGFDLEKATKIFAEFGYKETEFTFIHYYNYDVKPIDLFCVKLPPGDEEDDEDEEDEEEDVEVE